MHSKKHRTTLGGTGRTLGDVAWIKHSRWEAEGSDKHEHKSPALPAHCLKTCASQRQKHPQRRREEERRGQREERRGQEEERRGQGEERKRPGRGREELEQC
jgi:hypothetical protein